jgi:hypothetical protein
MLATVLVATLAFSPVSTNAYFPLKPGMRWEYRGSEDGAALRDVVTVKHGVEHVSGVPCAIVDDRQYADGKLVEATTDWYSQDARGRVWYFGEDTRELDAHGRTTSTEGSWRTGVDGARPGIIMPARLRVGATFRQEHYPGHAEDRFRILSRRARVTVPFGHFSRVLKTGEWTPLEPGVRDRKWYVRGVGTVKEATVKGGNERLELVSFTK